MEVKYIIPNKFLIDIKPKECSFIKMAPVQTKSWRAIYRGDNGRQPLPMHDFVPTPMIGLRDCSYAYTGGFIVLTIHDHQFRCFGIDQDKVDYLVIDSLDCISRIAFEKASEAITLLFGLLAGVCYKSIRYISGYTDFDQEQLTEFHFRLGQENSRPGFGTFPTRSIQISLGVNFDELIVGENAEFNKIAQKIHDNDEYARCIRLVAGNSGVDWETRIVLNTVVLESATNFVQSSRNSKGGILEHGVFGELRNKFLEIIDGFNSAITSDQRTLIRNKIEGLNSPPNSRKLSEPYEYFDILLNEEERKLISERNKLLHGKPLNFGKNTPEDYLKAAMILHYCCTSILLKAAGYSGPFIKFSSLVYLRQNKKLNDWVFTHI